MLGKKTKLELKIESNSINKKQAMFILVLLHKDLQRQKRFKSNNTLAYRKIFFIIKKLEQYLGITPKLKMAS